MSEETTNVVTPEIVAAVPETAKKILSRDDIFGANDIEFILVDIPEWGGSIRLKTLTADQALLFIEMTPEQRATILPRMVAECAVDEEGKMLFKPGDQDKLRGKSLRAFMRLSDQLLELNGLSDKKDSAKNASGEVAAVASPSA